MSTIDPITQQSLIELRGYAKAWHRVKAEEVFRRIVRSSDHATLTLISHDLTGILGEFEKKRKRDLSLLLTKKLECGPECASVSEVGKLTTLDDLIDDYERRLNDLSEKHIFQWATYYRDNIKYIINDAVHRTPALRSDNDAEERIQSIFATHSFDIFSRGYARVLERGLDYEIGVTKSLRGLQQFMHVVIGLLRDQRESALTKQLSTLYWNISSAIITGILLGYRNIIIADTKGEEILIDNLSAWLHMLGFCRGRHVLLLAQPGQSIIPNSEASVCSLLLGADRWSLQANTPAVLPKYSRVNIAVNRLDITYSLGVDRVSQDISVAAFFNGPTGTIGDLENALALKMIVIAELTEASRESVEAKFIHEVINAADAQGSIQKFESLAETVAASLTARSLPATTQSLSGKLPRNYAKDFPLDDPLFRRGQFEVERHSVNKIVQDLQRGIGAYVWCSVRRSGKTTSAEAIAGANDQTLVVVQSMDHRPNSLELNVLGSRVRAALEAGKAIPENFFGELVKDCVFATSQANVPKRNLVFIIDEYETLFDLIDGYTLRDPTLKATVSLPLISQMLGFSMKNTLLFMGQRPDAHMILLAQNQLSPNVRQHAFPLFEHQRGSPSEFATLVNRILTDNLRVSDGFVEAVYQETKGHPYLTVNVLVDFCDWLMASTTFELGSELSDQLFSDFAKERLDVNALRSSPHYSLFHRMLAEFSSERSRDQEPWLYAVTTILREIVRRHPKRLSCSLVVYDEITKPLEYLVRTTPRRLLTSATMANFLYESNGVVHAGIPLMARLAASATSKGIA